MTASNNVSANESGIAAGRSPGPGRRRTAVVIVGPGDDLLVEVGPALGDQYRSFTVDAPDEIADVSATSWIGVFDATHSDHARRTFAQLESEYGRQPWIVVCGDADRGTWRDVLARGAACAVIPRSELTIPAFTTALETATQRLAVGTVEVPLIAAVPQRRPLIWAAGAGAALVACGVIWWLSHSRSHPAVAVAPPGSLRPAVGGSAAVPTTTEPSPQGAPSSVEDLLSLARIAFRDPTTQLPKPDFPLQGTSALELYGAVLVQQPKNGEALDGVRRLQAVARLRIQNALAAGDADTGGRLLTILQHAGFAPEELHTLEAAVAAARPKQLAAQARSAIAAGNLTMARQLIDQIPVVDGERSPVAELRKQLDAHRIEQTLATQAEQVRAAVTANQLLEPTADNARTRFLSMRDLDRTSAQTVAVQHELLLALLRRAQGAIGRGDLDGAQKTLAAAQEFGSKAELAESRANLDAALNSKRATPTASATVKSDRTAGSAPDIRAQTAVPVIVSPKPTQDLKVDFPAKALADNIQGWAIVEFTLNPNGSTTGASIVEASPPGTFDAAALAAIRRASFSTTDLADPAKPQRARIRIKFALDNSTAPGSSTGTSQASTGPAPARNPAANPLGVLSPKPTRPLQVDYPRLALTLNRTGYVIVEFMLNPNGTPSNPTVVEAVPAKVFDYEAVAAVRRARFVTSGLSDPLKAQRARVMISFTGSSGAE